MYYKFIVIICLLLSMCGLQAQPHDTLTNKDVQREIEIIKQFRQKDSVRIALLLNEIQEFINAKKTNNDTKSTADSIAKKEKEIEQLRAKNSDAFKGISMFLGVLISLGSSSAISNAIVGVFISYMRPFQVGDWIKSGEIIGVVIEKKRFSNPFENY